MKTVIEEVQIRLGNELLKPEIIQKAINNLINNKDFHDAVVNYLVDFIKHYSYNQLT